MTGESPEGPTERHEGSKIAHPCRNPKLHGALLCMETQLQLPYMFQCWIKLSVQYTDNASSKLLPILKAEVKSLH